MIDIRGLAYVVAQSTNLEQWRDYAQGVLGMMVAPAPGGGLYLKMDERDFRFAIEPGARDAYLASGWEVLDAAAFDVALAHLSEQGVVFERGDAELCARRRVNGLVSFSDPAGNRQELVWGFQSEFRHFASPAGVARFITGEIGMGHTVLPAPNFNETTRFWREVMGFGLSDIFNFKPAGDAGPTIPIHFFHCNNGRHHSLALAAFGVESGCVHVMVEVESMPEVGRALDRMAAHGVPLSATLGQHTNDRMTSFYMRCPGNFDIEYGYGGAVVDWQEHIVHEFTRVSLWGHDFSVGAKG